MDLKCKVNLGMHFISALLSMVCDVHDSQGDKKLQQTRNKNMGSKISLCQTLTEHGGLSLRAERILRWSSLSKAASTTLSLYFEVTPPCPTIYRQPKGGAEPWAPWAKAAVPLQGHQSSRTGTPWAPGDLGAHSTTGREQGLSTNPERIVLLSP